jgi:hypothetical protein
VVQRRERGPGADPRGGVRAPGEGADRGSHHRGDLGGVGRSRGTDADVRRRRGAGSR